MIPSSRDHPEIKFLTNPLTLGEIWDNSLRSCEENEGTGIGIYLSSQRTVSLSELWHKKQPYHWVGRITTPAFSEHACHHGNSQTELFPTARHQIDSRILSRALIRLVWQCSSPKSGECSYWIYRIQPRGQGLSQQAIGQVEMDRSTRAGLHGSSNGTSPPLPHQLMSRKLKLKLNFELEGCIQMYPSHVTTYYSYFINSNDYKFFERSGCHILKVNDLRGRRSSKCDCIEGLQKWFRSFDWDGRRSTLWW